MKIQVYHKVFKGGGGGDLKTNHNIQQNKVIIPLETNDKCQNDQTPTS